MVLITKEIYPVGEIKTVRKVSRFRESKEIKEMEIVSMVAEYRFCGLLIYRKMLLTPYHFEADYFRGFNTKF